MENKGIILDIDDTLADTSVAMAQRILKQFSLTSIVPIEKALETCGMPELVTDWQDEMIQQEIMRLSNDKEFIFSISPIRSALEHVTQLSKRVPILAYITSRLTPLEEVTNQWLAMHCFPAAPVILRDVRIVEKDWKLKFISTYSPNALAYIDNEIHVPERHSFQGRSIEIIRHKKISPTHSTVEVFSDWQELIQTL